MRNSLLSPGLQFLVLVTVLSFFLMGSVRAATNLRDSVIQPTTAQGVANRAYKNILANVSSRDDVSNFNAAPVLNPMNLVPSIFIRTSAQEFKLAALDPADGKMSLSRSQTSAVNPSATPVNSSASLPRTFFSMNWSHFITLSTWPSVPIGSIRLWDNYVSWEEIETAPGRYNWTNLDTWLGAAAANDTDVLYTFGRTPPWGSLRPREACGYGVGCAAPPVDVDSGDNVWKAFVTALVQHSLASKTSHIKYYELWNEPDCEPARSNWCRLATRLLRCGRRCVSRHSFFPCLCGPQPKFTAVYCR
jgi:hypothetical protein